MTRNGLEWLYRITTEPKRYWRRYARDLEYFWLLVVDGLGVRRLPGIDGRRCAAKGTCQRYCHGPDEGRRQNCHPE